LLCPMNWCEEKSPSGWWIGVRVIFCTERLKQGGRGWQGVKKEVK